MMFLRFIRDVVYVSGLVFFYCSVVFNHMNILNLIIHSLIERYSVCLQFETIMTKIREAFIFLPVPNWKQSSINNRIDDKL